ncbi:MAG: LysR family transcriptional regulator, partial [Bdellovibrio sp.]
MKNLYQLTTFVTVVSEGSMTAAADKLYLTQPAVSQQIRNLEEDLGVELLVRGVRQVKATPQGEVLYEYAKRIINLTQQAEIAIKSIGNQMRGQLRIGTLNSLGLHLMSPIVGRLMRHNPDLSLKIDYGLGEELIKGFKKGLYDILILPDVKVEFAAELENCEQKFFVKEEMWLVGSNKEERMPQQIGIKDLGSFPVVNFTEEFPGFNRAVNDRLSASGVRIR